MDIGTIAVELQQITAAKPEVSFSLCLGWSYGYGFSVMVMSQFEWICSFSGGYPSL